MPFFGFIGLLFPLVFLVLIVAVVALVAGGKRESDPTGRRTYAIYLSTVVFVVLFTTIAAIFGAVHSLAELVFVGDAGGVRDFISPGGFTTEVPLEQFPEPSGSGREALMAALIAAVSGLVLYLHGGKLLELRGAEPSPDSPAGRVLLVLGYAVCFFAVFGALGAAAAVLNGLVDAIDPPGGFGGSSDQATATLVSAGLLTAGLGFLFRYTWQKFDLGPRGVMTPPAPPQPPAP